jgi:hypothetical protein
MDFDPMFLGDPVGVVAPVVVEEVLAAQVGQRRRGPACVRRKPPDLDQPLVLGLLALVGEDVVVGAHEIEVIP